ncbi:hypothetical protein GCM10010400_14040 [Streptomyces aculeolatus]
MRFVAGVVVVQDFTGRGIVRGGGAGQVHRVCAPAGCGDLLEPAGEAGVLGQAYEVLVCGGELTRARRVLECGAPVSRGVVRGDGGDLPGWAAAAAGRLDAGGWG